MDHARVPAMKPPMASRSILGFLVMICSLGCKPSPPPSPSASPLSANAVEPTNGPAIDDLFRGFETKLPEAETLGEQNGPFVRCLGNRGATVTLLRALAAKVPILSDLDLVRLVPWARHPDPCVSQIALRTIALQIGYDEDSLYAFLDPEGFQYHDVFVSVKAHLDRKRVPYDPTIFEGLLIIVDANDFPALIHGHWFEDEDFSGFKEFVEVDREHVQITRKLLPLGSRPDSTSTTKITSVVSNEHRQFVVAVSGASSITGAAGKPEPVVYSFWPVKNGVMWFKNGQHAAWKKMRKRGS